MKLSTLIEFGAASCSVAMLTSGAPIAIPVACAVAAFIIHGVRNSNSNPAMVMHNVLVASISLLSNAQSANAMVNGIPPTTRGGNSAPNLHPHLGTCTSIRTGLRQILTARHCIEGHVSTWVTDRGGMLQVHIKKDAHVWADLAFVTYPRTIFGDLLCPPPLMKPEVYLKMKAERFKSPKCGPLLEGELIVTGRGLQSSSALSNAYGEATSGIFSTLREAWNLGTIGGIPYSRPSTSSNGLDGDLTEITGKGSSIRGGDSGGPVLGCNPKTGKYELVGIVKSETEFTNMAKNTTLTEWYEAHRNGCSEPELTAYELYPSSKLSRRNRPPARRCITKTPLRSGGSRLNNECGETISAKVKHRDGRTRRIMFTPLQKKDMRTVKSGETGVTEVKYLNKKEIERMKAMACVQATKTNSGHSALAASPQVNLQNKCDKPTTTTLTEFCGNKRTRTQKIIYLQPGQKETVKNQNCKGLRFHQVSEFGDKRKQ